MFKRGIKKILSKGLFLLEVFRECLIVENKSQHEFLVEENVVEEQVLS